MTTAEPINNAPLRILNRGPDYLKSTSISSQSSEGRRKTAAERLEADKLKYVKSAKVRQRRATIEIHSNSSPNNGSTGAHSMGTASSGSRDNIDHENASDYNGIDAMEESKSVGAQLFKSQSNQTRQSSGQKLNRSNTDIDNASKMRLLNSNRFRQKCVVEQTTSSSPSGATVTKLKDLNCGPPDIRRNRSQSPKDGRGGKSFSAYLYKAKEGIKAVTSSLSGVNSETPSLERTRQSRSAVTKFSKLRSASVGANVHRQVKENQTDLQKLSAPNNTDTVMLSPRSQLKHARQNLKKVNSSNNDENITSPSNKVRLNTFTVNPRKTTFESKVKADFSVENNVKLRSTQTIKPGRLNRPLSVIENRVTQNISQFEQEFNDDNDKNMQNSSKNQSSSMKEEPSLQGNDVDMMCGGASARRLSAQRLKRRSWDLVQSMDNSLQLLLSKPVTQLPQGTLEAELSFSNTPRQRKSWSRAPPSTSDYRKNGNRISFHEDMNNVRAGNRKSITEALEEIINPPDVDDDMDTAYNSMSPDASVDCKTLVGPTNSTFGEKSNNSIAENINNILRGSGFNDKRSRSKTPESSRSKTPTGDDGISVGANDVDINVKDLMQQDPPPSVEWHKKSHNSSSNSPLTSGYSSVVPTTDQRWLNSNEPQPAVTQPLNRIDLAPTTNLQFNGGIPNSPMLAPKSRREVAPDCPNRNPTNAVDRGNITKDENVNTLASRHTSSSASGDVNKPFTALTASDLKPRRGKRGVVPPSTTPLKPTCPYAANNYRGSPKRHNNAPVSPTSSPHKQAARMTPPQGSKSSSSTPYSSLKRTPTSSRSSSLKRNRQRSKSDVSILPTELDRFFSNMGMEEFIFSPLPGSHDTLFTTAHVSSESDFSFAGASAYVRDSVEESMDVDPVTAGLASVPSVSIIEKNARVMRWLMSCKKSMVSSPRSPRHAPPVPTTPTRPQSSHNHHFQHFPSYPPPIPPRISSYQKVATGLPKESDV